MRAAAAVTMMTAVLALASSGLGAAEPSPALRQLVADATKEGAGWTEVAEVLPAPATATPALGQLAPPFVLFGGPLDGETVESVEERGDGGWREGLGKDDSTQMNRLARGQARFRVFALIPAPTRRSVPIDQGPTHRPDTRTRPPAPNRAKTRLRFLRRNLLPHAASLWRPDGVEPLRAIHCDDRDP